MPRSYSFDHYTAKNPEESRGVREDEKQAVAQSASQAGGSTGVHYGKKFAQTEELIAAKMMDRQLEELAGLSPEEPEQKASAPAPEHKEVQEPVPGGVPIGALPAPEELPPAPEVQGILDHGIRGIQFASSALRDLTRAGLQLALLPLHAGRLLAKRLQTRRA